MKALASIPRFVDNLSILSQFNLSTFLVEGVC